MFVTRYSKEFENEWEEFVDSSVNGTFMQKRRFLSYHPFGRFLDHSLLFIDDNQIIAVLPAAELQHDDKTILVSHPGASHGGLIIRPGLSTKKCLDLVSSLIEYCTMLGFDYIRLKPVPKIYHKELSDQLDFALRFFGFSLEYTELATVLELKKCKESSIKEIMSNTAYRNYQKAIKSGLYVVDDGDINDFWPILENKLKTNHNAKPTHTLDEIRLLKTLYPDSIKLFTAYEGAAPAAGVLTFLLNPRVINCFYIAHNDNFQLKRPLNLIFGHMMKWGIKNGFSYLDWGISTESKGNEINAGLFHFKEGFGGHGVLRECYLYKINKNQ